MGVKGSLRSGLPSVCRPVCVPSQPDALRSGPAQLHGYLARPVGTPAHLSHRGQVLEFGMCHSSDANPEEALIKLELYQWFGTFDVGMGYPGALGQVPHVLAI